MTTRKSIEEVKNKFKTGDIPTGQDYADFIDVAFNYIDEALIVQKVNGVSPDIEGNVQTSFQVTEFIPPDAPITDYPPGTSEFYGDYDPADYPEFIEENPSFEQLEAGMICVRTYYDEASQFAFQQVDNIKNGIFEASYTRVCQDGVLGELVFVVKPPEPVRAKRYCFATLPHSPSFEVLEQGSTVTGFDVYHGNSDMVDPETGNLLLNTTSKFLITFDSNIEFEDPENGELLIYLGKSGADTYYSDGAFVKYGNTNPNGRTGTGSLCTIIDGYTSASVYLKVGIASGGPKFVGGGGARAHITIQEL